MFLIKLPYKKLDEAHLELEFFLRCKQAFRNGRVYNYTNITLFSKLRSRGVKTTPRKLKQATQKWFSLGWVSMDGGTLVFDTNKDRRCKSVELQHLTYEIRKSVILKNFKQQEFAFKTKRNLNYPKNLKAHSAAKRNRRKLKDDTSKFISEVMLGYRTMGEMLGISHVSAFMVVSRMLKEGDITSKQPSKSYVRRSDNFLTRVPNSYTL